MKNYIIAVSLLLRFELLLKTKCKAKYSNSDFKSSNKVHKSYFNEYKNLLCGRNSQRM